MKILIRRSASVLIVFLLLSYFTSIAQNNSIDTSSLYFPGPANQDTSTFAFIYLYRPETNDPLSQFWDTFFINGNPMARIFNNRKYIIRCAPIGTVEISCGVSGKNSLQKINVQPGKKFFIRFIVSGKTRKPLTAFELLGDDEGSMAFDSIKTEPINIYDPDPMEMTFHGQRIPTSYVVGINHRVGFNEFTFTHPISVRHYFASPQLGYEYTYVNKMVCPSYSEAVFIQRMGDFDFGSQQEFNQFIKMKLDEANKGLLKASETVIDTSYIDLNTPADLSFASYIVTEDTKPLGTDMHGNPYVVVRTWQAYMYKKQVKGNRGRIFQVSFTERGLPAEVHSKEAMFYKMNLLLQNSQFGKVLE